MGITMNNNYKDIKCPHCGKSHFSVYHSTTDMIPAVFMIHPDPIYKDGILQNPEIYEPKPESEHCTCQECGKKFWINTKYEYGQHFRSVETEEERDKRLKDEWNNLFNSKKEVNKEVQEEVEKVTQITGAKIGDTNVEDITNIANLDVGNSIITYKSDEPIIATLDISTTSKCIEELKDKIEDISKRLEIIEGKLNDK